MHRVDLLSQDVPCLHMLTMLCVLHTPRCCTIELIICDVVVIIFDVVVCSFSIPAWDSRYSRDEKPHVAQQGHVPSGYIRNVIQSSDRMLPLFQTSMNIEKHETYVSLSLPKACSILSVV